MSEAENRLLGNADEDQETPATTLQAGPQVVSSASRSTAVSRPPRKTQPSSVLADLMAKGKKPKIQNTPLHINISVLLDNALRRAMVETGLEKTAIVTGALMPVLAPYMDEEA